MHCSLAAALAPRMSRAMHALGPFVLICVHIDICCTACSGLGYCFSAALPPYLTTAATGAIDKVEREGRQLAEACTANARSLRGLLSDIPGAHGRRDNSAGAAVCLPGSWLMEAGQVLLQQCSCRAVEQL